MGPLKVSTDEFIFFNSCQPPIIRHAICCGYFSQHIRQGELSAITVAMTLPTFSMEGLFFGSDLALLYSVKPMARKPVLIKIEKDEEKESEEYEEEEKEVE